MSKKKNLWPKDKAFYLKLWEKSDKRCIVTGKYLGQEPLSTFFHHILPKSRFPEYRWCEWNIAILHPDVHNQVELDIDRVPMIKELTKELVRKHENGELLNCDG